MDVFSEDSKRFIDVGSADIWNTLNVNLEVLMKKDKRNIRHALKFMKKLLDEIIGTLEYASKYKMGINCPEM